MKLSQTLPAISLAFALTAPLALLARADGDALPSGPTDTQATTAKLVYGLLSDSRYAYRPRALDDSLSQEVFKRYLEALDPGKVFFTAQDLAKFASHKTRLDDAIKGAGLQPAYAMFALYKQRVNERVAHARGLHKGSFDFSGNDKYEFDREDAAWAADRAALDALCMQSV
jgi:carboxyl-terminal processing protease